MENYQKLQNLFFITREIKNYLQFLAEMGCKGVDETGNWELGTGNWEPAKSQLARVKSQEPATNSKYPKANTQNPTVLPPLATIRKEMGNCQCCKLCDSRTNIVFGAGDSNAQLVFIADVPRYEEDQKGLPFMGETGGLLTNILRAMNLKREQVYICNVVKCRTPENRKPESDEVIACLPFLKRQLRVIKPKLICAFGEFVAQTLLETTTPISALRGRFYDYMGIKLLPTFHPEYLLRNRHKRKEIWAPVWEDMKTLMNELKNS